MPVETQIHLRNSSVAEDRTRVHQLLVSTAVEFDIADNTETSRVPDTITCYSERVGHGFALGARMVDAMIIVDFFPGKEPSPLFSIVREHISSKLRGMFGERAYFAPPSEHIAPQHTLPFSEAGREFHRRGFRLNSPED